MMFLFVKNTTTGSIFKVIEGSFVLFSVEEEGKKLVKKIDKLTKRN